MPVILVCYPREFIYGIHHFDFGFNCIMAIISRFILPEAIILIIISVLIFIWLFHQLISGRRRINLSIISIHIRSHRRHETGRRNNHDFLRSWAIPPSRTMILINRRIPPKHGPFLILLMKPLLRKNFLNILIDLDFQVQGIVVFFSICYYVLAPCWGGLSFLILWKVLLI